ncbi:MAG: copper amine oxidase N-terminal domain-containing protein, partial [Mobilitalea sp.]
MIHFTKRITNRQKDYLIQNRFLFLKIVCMLIVAILTTGFSVNTVQAASGLRIYNYATKKNSVYSDKLIKVSYNGSTIGRTQTPGILVDGVALVPYNDVFEKSGIDADCIYNKDKGTVSISKYGITILMTIGSKKAIVNGKTVILPVAPIKIKYRDIDLAKVLVPSRYVSETLGLGYLWNGVKSTVSIEKYTKLLSYNSGKKFEYTGIQGSVTIDNKKVELGDMSSIILNNTAMLRAAKVFADSKIGAQYEYNKVDKTVTLSKDSNVLVMTIGSTIANLNGKSMMLDTAPIIVKNYDSGKSYVMVPGGFTAASLGFDYTWNKSKKTSMITSHKEETVSNGSGNSNTEPELGDSGVIIEIGTILYRWQGLDSLFGKSSGMHELNIGVVDIANPGSIVSVTRDYNNLKQNSETFMIFGTTPLGKITSSQSGKKITIHVAGINSTDQTYQMFGTSSNLVNSIGTYNNAGDNSTTIELDVLPENYMYDLSLSSDKQILYISVYLNSVTSSVIGVNNAGDYITLGGLSALDVTITTNPGLVYIDIPNATNSLGDLFADVIGANYIKSFYSISYPNKTQIILSMNEGYDQYISENGNQYTISFQKPGAIVQPEQPEQPETPEVIDISNYEIIIPKPEGITSTMISHEDYYFNNCFVIKIPGDFTEYFNSHMITNNSSVIENLSITLNSNYETEILISTSRLQGYAIASD